MAQAAPVAGNSQKAKPAEQMTQTTDQPPRPQMGADTPPPPQPQQGTLFTDWASI